MVSKDDLIRTVTTAYSSGWRQVKLYFMCGLPTETDEDVLQIAEMAHDVIRAGREATGSRDIRCTVSHRRVRAQAAHAVPVGARSSTRGRDERLRKLRDAISANRSLGPQRSASATTTASPAIVEGLLSRGDRRVGAVIERGVRATAAASTAGASTSPTTAG